MGVPFFAAIRRHAESDPGRPSLTVGDETITRAELVAAAEGVAEAFAQRGVKAGDWVTIVLPNSVEFVQASLAAWLLGATPQPINHRLPPEELAAIIGFADPAVVVGTDAAVTGGRPVMSAADVRAAADGPTPAEQREAVMSPEWKVVTSGGSTGRPKLIVTSTEADAEVVGPLGLLLRLKPDGVVVNTGPMSHNAPFVTMIAGILLGNHVVVMPRFDAAQTLALVEQHGADWLYLVPTMMLRIFKLPEEERLSYDLSALQVAFHMAAPCPPWLKRAWIEWLGPEKILELYGGTELQALTIIDGTEWLEHPGSVGKPVLGEIEERDGELWMRRGDGTVPYRYVGAEAKSAGEQWESLGDLGHVDDDGYVYITDRIADMILVGGENVYPAEIEAVLDEHPAVQSSCVIGLPHEDLGNVPHAIVQLAGDASDEDLLEHVSARLVPIKRPRTFERVDEPLRDDAGKVRRSQLRAERL